MSQDLMTTMRATHGGVVVPTGFGGDDERAFAHGLRLAEAMGTSMTNLHHGDLGSMPASMGVRAVLERWGELPEGSAPEDVAKLGFWVRKQGVRKSDMVAVVTDFVRDHALDMLVVSTRDSALSRIVGGAGPMATKADVPTLFLSAKSSDLVDASTGIARLHTVVVPVAAKPSAESAVHLTHSLARHLKASEGRIVLLHVGDAPAPDMPIAGDGGWTYETRHASGAASAAICAVSRDVEADAIAMTTSGRRGLLDALRGSTVERVVADAPCPVLAIPARG